MTLLGASSSNRSYGTVHSDREMGDREDDQLLYSTVSEHDGPPGAEDDDNFSSSDGEVQDGVRMIEAVSLTWTRRSLTVAYLG